VDAADSTDAVQGEAEAELDGEELDRDDDEEAVSRASVRQPGVDEPDRAHFHAEDFERKHSGVTAVGFVEGDETATADRPGIDDQPDTGGRFEGEIELQRPDIAAAWRQRERGEETQPVYHRSHRPNFGRDRRGELYRNGTVFYAGAEIGANEVNRTQRQIERNLNLQHAAALELHPTGQTPGKTEIEWRVDLYAGKNPGEESVTLAGIHQQTAAANRGADLRLHGRFPGHTVPVEANTDLAIHLGNFKPAPTCFPEQNERRGGMALD
jgi:hypothetical protein